jgi:hypothetical protein
MNIHSTIDIVSRPVFSHLASFYFAKQLIHSNRRLSSDTVVRKSGKQPLLRKVDDEGSTLDSRLAGYHDNHRR